LEKGTRVSLKHISKQISNARAHGEVDLLWALSTTLENRMAVDPPVYRLLISSFGEQQQLDRALAVFEGMREAGVTPDKDVMCALLNACYEAAEHSNDTAGREKALEQALEIWEQCKVLGLSNHMQVVSRYINICGLTGDVQQAFDLFRGIGCLKASELNTRCLNSLVKACLRCHNGALAIDAITEARQFGVEPDKYTLSMLITSSAKSGNAADHAFRIYTQGTDWVSGLCQFISVEASCPLCQ
jgi:pentatricopeptide repeat protein